MTLRPKAWLAFAFAEGFAGVAGQAVVVRELVTAFGGNELVVGVVFGCWLLWVSVGAGACSRALRRRETRAGSRAALAAGAALGPLLFAEFLLVRTLGGALLASPGELASLPRAAVGAAVLLAPFSLAVGAFFPLTVREYARCGGSGHPAARVYWAEAAGSLAGGLVFSLVLAGRVSHAGAVTAMAGALAAVAVSVSLVTRPRVPQDGGRPRLRGALGWGAAAAFASVAAAAAISGPLERLTARRGGLIDPSYRVVEARDTPYQHLTLVERSGQFTLFAAGVPAVSYEPVDPGPRIDAHRALVHAPSVRRCLLVGFEPGAVRAMLEQGAELVDVVELDPGVIELLLPRLAPEDARCARDAAVNIRFDDVRRFLPVSDRRYDFVMLMARDPASALVNRLFTVDFFRDVRRSMAPGGVFTFTASSQANWQDEDARAYLKGLRETLAAAWPEHALAYEEGGVRFLATDRPGALTHEVEVLRDRASRRAPALAQYFSEPNLAPERSRRLEEVLSSRGAGGGGPPPDRDLRPRTYVRFLRLWDRLSGSGVRAWLEVAERLRLWHLAAAAFLLCVPLALLGLGPRAERWAAPLAACGSGAGGMVATIALILAYQSLHGTVYQAIGALTASFMFGFAAGGALAGALLSRGFAPARTALAADAGGLACALASALVLWTGAAGANLAGKLLLALLLAGAGLSCGVELPALAGWLGRPAEDLDPAARTARGAGLVDASDHAGAFVGAIVAGTLLVPALGVLGALVGVATLRLASLAPLGAACLRGLFRGRAGPRSGRERPARAG